MVEGPKVHLKVRRLLPLINANLVDFQAHKQPGIFEAKILEKFLFYRVSVINCIGKELFIVFMDLEYVMRIHFGMSGSEKLTKNDIAKEKVIENAKWKSHNFTIIFDVYTLTLFDVTLEMKTLKYYNKIQSNIHLDMLSLYFDAEKLLKLIQIDERIISDCIMDQSICPGVGNIIKCEGLFNSRIHPDAISCQLSKDEIMRLIVALKDFSILWFRFSENHRNPDYHIYLKDICICCKGKVTLVRQGHMNRITYFCSICQINNTSSKLNQIAAPLNDKKLSDEQDYLLPHSCKCGRNAKLSRSRKSGVNINRLFWSCSLPISNKTRCNFFNWADSRFPKCLHNKVSILRRVLKPGENNGKYFFVCSNEERSQHCKFFQWANKEISKNVEIDENTDSNVNDSENTYKRIRYSLDVQTRAEIPL